MRSGMSDEESLMRIRLAALLLMVFMLASCNSTSVSSVTPPAAAARIYHGTASVGDFMTITVDSGAKTISYTDVSNNTSGTVPYVVNSDGTYTLNDPTGNLVGAYEVPNYALLIQAAKTGPNADTPALITAVESGQISLGTFEAHAYNTMQFRTAAGGLEVGTISVNAQGQGSISSFWPYGAFNPGNQSSSPFNTGTIDMSQAQLDSSGTFLKVPEPNNEPGFAYVFGTADGIFAVDTPNGAILGLKKAVSKDFDPTVAGTYKAIYYQKAGASTGQGNVETGTASLGNASVVVSGGGVVTVTDARGNQIVQGTITPVADTSYLYGSSGKLTDPCYGVFTFRITTPNVSQQDVFVTFMDKAMLFASFTGNLSANSSGTYSYMYGVALK
jgi:hypothetical protein